MELTNLLDKILALGIKEGFFEITTLGELEKSTSSCVNNLTIEVIDFDKTEVIHRKICNSVSLKSCDAIKLITAKQCIDFVEIKGFKEFINRNLHQEHSIDIQVKEKVMKFDFMTKIDDSLTVLTNLINSTFFDFTSVERKYFREIEKFFIILIDIEVDENPIVDLAISLSFLSEASSNIELIVSNYLKDEIDELKISQFKNLRKPILMSCKSIVERYR